MNIWYVHPYGGGPGIGRFFRPYHLAREWQKSGHQTTVFVSDFHHLLDKREKLAPFQSVDGIPYVALEAGEYQGNGLGRILNMARFCRSLWGLRKRIGRDLRKPDAIIVSSPHPFAIFPARALARRYGAKLVFEVRDLWPLSITEINGTSRWHPFVLLTAFTERYAYKHADVVASLLPGVETYMRERGMVYKQFVWVPNGIVEGEHDPLPPESDEGRRLLQVVKGWKETGRAIIIHPGSMGPPNALELLIDAAAILGRDGLAERFGILLVGAGISRATLERRTQELALDNVVFGGPIPKAEAQYLVAHCDIGYCGGRAHDTVYRYGINFNKIMDFISAGLPFVLPFQAQIYQNAERIEGLQSADSDSVSIAAAIGRSLGASAPTTNRSKRFATMKSIFDFQAVAAGYLVPLTDGFSEGETAS